MRKRLLIGVLGTALIVAVVGSVTLVGVASPSHTVPNGWAGTATSRSTLGGASMPTITRATTLHLVFQDTKNTFIDLGAPGVSVGDLNVISGPLWNASRSKIVGFLAADCTLTNPQRNFLFECEITANLNGAFPAGSEITLEGFSSNATHWFNAVNGGTGMYQNVRGEAELRNIPNSLYIDVLLRLIP